METQTQEEAEEITPSVLLGSIDCEVVGIRYYDGEAHPGEYVAMVREPTNPYDRNAIRVDNMAGAKVGHIKARIAVALAPIMDRLSVKLDGTISSTGNAYTLPLHIDFHGFSLEDVEDVDRILKTHRQRWKKIKSKSSVKVTKTSVNWRDGQKNLDDIFSSLTENQLTNLPDLPSLLPLTTTLLEHQAKGVRWMYQQEIDSKIAPFYKQIKEKGQTVWFSNITNSSQTTPPLPAKGSILADDMGLGKTLQAIGLILANRAPADKPKTSLVVCPLSVMSNWIHQIQQHVVPDTLKVVLYHGPSRSDLLEGDGLNDVDVLIASYGTVTTDYGYFAPKSAKKEPKKKKQKPSKTLFDCAFHRVILDEAHIIRNIKTRTFAGCKSLKTNYRLCLTGTPLQNKPEDIQSLFSFLNVEPLGDKDIFRRAIAQPIQNGDDPTGFARLRTMMAHISLRRNKTGTLNLVEKTVELRSVSFPEDSGHTMIHDTLFRSTQGAFRAALAAEGDKVLRNYMVILEALTRIRQACVSGCLVPPERLEAAEQVLAVINGTSVTLTAAEGEKLLLKLKGAFEGSDDVVECAVCMDIMQQNDAVILRTCSHMFCETCIATISAKYQGSCPMCRQPFDKQDMIKQQVAASAAIVTPEKKKASQAMAKDDLGASPKLLALGDALAEMKEDEKGVVFSQFTKFLDVIEVYLEAKGYATVRIDGSKSPKQRNTAMEQFSADGGPRVMLCSLHAAGTGITLTRANHCFMMDTWWNVSVENQAMDRVHRIGQTRPVRVLRFVMKGTIEERMITLQEAKAAIGKGALQKLKPEELRKTRIGDLISLFSIDDGCS